MNWDETDHRLDIHQYLTPSHRGIDLAQLLRNWTGEPIFPTAEYLAVGVGGAVGELAFAEELGIDPARITLLDKQLPEIPEANSSTRRVSEGIFSFLAKEPTRTYDVVSAFGMEYVFRDGVVSQFLDALVLHLNPGARVLIYPYDGTTIQHNFFQIRNPYMDTHARPMLYQFTGKPRR